MASPHSGIFGYVNYLVEKDRNFILQTLLNGELQAREASMSTTVADPTSPTQASRDSNTVVTTPPV